MTTHDPAGGLRRQLTPDELHMLQNRLMALLARRTTLYTGGDSSSVPSELAQELLRSICFTLGMADETAVLPLLSADLEQCLKAGMTQLERKLRHGKGLWQAACLSAPPVHSLSLEETLTGIGAFWRQYDHRFFAHQIPCDIDYQLCHPVPESLLGVDYVNEYLRRLLTENNLLSKFPLQNIIGVLKSSCPDYRGLLMNLYTPVAVNAIGLMLLGADPRKLDITPRALERLTALLASQGPDNTQALLQKAAETLCDTLELGQERACVYLKKLSAELIPRIGAALPNGSLGNVFLHFESAV